MYAFDHAALRDALGRITPDNAQGEEYLPDAVAILVGDGRAVGAVVAPATETAGVNDRVQLAAAHRTYNDRLLDAHMRAGVTVVDPATTWVDATVQPRAATSTLLPSTQLHGATTVAEGATVGPDSTLTDTDVGAGGPRRPHRREAGRGSARASPSARTPTCGRAPSSPTTCTSARTSS